MVSITPPQRETHNFSLNPFELISNYLPPLLGGKETATSYSYNQDEQLTKIKRPDGKIINFSYNPKTAELEKILTPNGIVSHEYYEESGQLSKITSPDNVVSNFEYTGPLFRKEQTQIGNINSESSLDYNTDFSLKALNINDGHSLSKVVYAYDRDNLPVKIGSENLSYDSSGLLSGIKHGPFEQSLKRNAYGEIVEENFSILNKHKKLKNNRFLYKRDSLGRVIQKIVYFSNEGENIFNYRYDSKGQLVEVSNNHRVIRKYVYDANGNRIKKIEDGKVIVATYDEQDRLVSYGKSKYKYNANGDLEEKITDEGKSLKFEYDVFGNLKKVYVGKKDVIEYLVDGRNRRVGKKVNGELIQAFVYQSQTQIAAELDGTGRIVKRFVYGSKPNVPDFFISNGKKFQIISDQVGTPKIIIDLSSGEVINELEYDEFGIIGEGSRTFSKNISKIKIPFGFAGGLYDPLTDFLRFGKRDYYSRVGRWMSKDPLVFSGGDSNLYSYVFQDPINFIDKEGTDAVLVTVLVGGIIPHSIIGVSTPNQGTVYFEFSPASMKDALFSLFGFNVKGGVNISKSFPDSTILNSQYFSLTAEQDRRLLWRLLKNPGQYNIIKNNCFNFTDNACTNTCK